MTDKEKRIRSLIAYRSVIAPEDIDGAFPSITTASGINDLSETRMDNGRKVFIKMNAMNTTYYRDLYKPNTAF